MRKRPPIIISLAFAGLSTTACATSFTGSAHVEEGRTGCEAKCQGQGMELVGMVYMGEYSDGCVCAVPGQSAAMVQQLQASATLIAGTAGVAMQTSRQAQQHQHH